MNKRISAFIGILVIAIIVFVLLSLRAAAPQSFRESAATSSSAYSPSAAENTDGSIAILSPAPNSHIESPLHIAGQAKSAWYFEGQFPVELVDTEGNMLAKTAAHAEGDSMQSGFIAFSLTLDFPAPTTTPDGLLIFKNDNSSGDPSKDIIFAIPVQFR